MANDLTRNEAANIVNLNLGTVDVSKLTEEQRNELNYLVAKSSIELATELKKHQIHLQSTTAEMDATITAMTGARRAGLNIRDDYTLATPNGSHHMTIKTKGIFG